MSYLGALESLKAAQNAAIAVSSISLIGTLAAYIAISFFFNGEKDFGAFRYLWVIMTAVCMYFVGALVSAMSGSLRATNFTIFGLAAVAAAGCVLSIYYDLRDERSAVLSGDVVVSLTGNRLWALPIAHMIVAFAFGITEVAMFVFHARLWSWVRITSPQARAAMARAVSNYDVGKSE